MYSVLKICGASLLAVALSSVLKQRSSALAPYLTEITAIIILTSVLTSVSPLTEFISGFKRTSPVFDKVSEVLYKSVGSAIICRTVSDICRENGENTLSSVVEFAGNAIITVSSLPLISTLFDTVCSVTGL